MIPLDVAAVLFPATVIRSAFGFGRFVLAAVEAVSPAEAEQDLPPCLFDARHG
jgi:hypothetical protein